MLTKSQEKRIQEVIRMVHERRLGDSLVLVEQAIQDWRDGILPILKVDDVIRQHMQKATRFFSRYANIAARDLEAAGVLDEGRDLELISEAEYRSLVFPAAPASAPPPREFPKLQH